MKRTDRHRRITSVNLYSIIDQCRYYHVLEHNAVIEYCIVEAFRRMGYQLEPNLLSLLDKVDRQAFKKTESVVLKPLETLLWDIIPTNGEITMVEMIGRYGCVIYQEIEDVATW